MIEIPLVSAPKDGAVVLIKSWPEHGEVALSFDESSTINYTADSSFVGVDSFVYEVSFADGHSQATVVNIIVPQAVPGQ